MKSFRSWLCAMLVLAMVLGSVPVTARAAEITEPEGTVAEEQTATIPETTGETEPEVTEVTEPEVTEEPALQKGDIMSIPFQVNPLYEGIYTADDFPASHQNELYQGELYASTTYLTVAKAGEKVRTAMKNRQDSISVSFKTKIASAQTACEEVMAEAMKHTGDPLGGDYLMWQYAGWSGPSVSRRYNDSTQMYEYSATLRISYYTTAQQEAELTTAINKLKTSLKLSGKSNYDKIFAVYDYMCQNITYDYDNLNDSSYKLKHTAYAALINKTAVCQGYALLFYRIMLELGIDCRLIAGYGNGGAHGWNIVKLDGLYYNLDSTWDAGYDEYVWFLNSYWDFGLHERDMEYDTIAFHNQYPIAAESYQKGVTGTKDPYIAAGYAGAETTNVVWYLGRDGSITFKGEGAIYNFAPSGKYAPFYSYWKDEITKVVVEEGITRMGTDCFNRFSALEEVILSSTVTEIGSHAFTYCNSLKTVTLPEGLQSIDYGAFEHCIALTSIDFSSINVRLGQYAFRDCDSLTEVRIHEGMSLSSHCFYSCDNLKRVWIDCAAVPMNAFEFCSGMTELVLTDRVKTIGSRAFGQCQSLISVTLPETLTEISESCFYGCEKLEKIDFPESLQIIGKSAFSGCGFTQVDIPGSITMQENAFSNCKKLEWVKLDCEVVPRNAFSGCSALTEIVLTDHVTTIGKEAFNNCDALTEVVIPESVTKLSGFSSCSNLISVTLPENLTEIGNSCFYACGKLETIDLPDGLLTIGENAFGYSVFTHIDLPETVTTIDNSAFEGSSLTHIDIPESVETIGIGAFSNCNSLVSATLPEKMTEVAESCFSGCKKLEKVNLPQGLLTIGRYAFKGCGFTQFHIPETVTTINYGAFSECDNLTEMVIPASVTFLSGFNECGGLERVELHNSGAIDGYAFYGCRNLRGINFPEGLTSIGIAAFQYCSSLTDVVIPESVTSLSGNAFYSCINLKSATLNNHGAVDAYAFSGCRKLTSVTFGENITRIYMAAFSGCIALTETIFEGNAPAIDSSAFRDVTATAHYPMNASWTEDKLQNYGGNITWVGYSVCTEHEYSAVVTNPTCTEGGFTTYTCTICGESYVGDEVEATGHSYDATVTAPTCTKRGFTTYTCAVCGDSYADDYVDALGHKFENEICTVCGSPERIPGDIDGNETVDVDDVLALLWYVLFPDDYPIEAEADFDGNGSTDVDDVLTLLWYVLFPEEYPLN